jgi:ankyrin repeat protein
MKRKDTFQVIVVLLLLNFRALGGMDQFIAARHGNLKELRSLLTKTNVNDLDGDGDSALHLASMTGDMDCIKLCIEMGANVRMRNNIGHTPLHLSVVRNVNWNSLKNCVDVANVLLDVGAFVDDTNNSGSTALYGALLVQISKPKRRRIVRLLIDRGGKVSNVKVDKYLPAVPDWVTAFIASRANCRCVAIVIIGIHKYRRTNITGNNDINVLRLISKHIWSTRMKGGWGLK